MTHLSNKRRSCDSLRALGVVSDHVTAGTLECFFFALLFVSHMAVEKKVSKGLSRICEVFLTLSL